MATMGTTACPNQFGAGVAATILQSANWRIDPRLRQPTGAFGTTAVAVGNQYACS